MATIDLRPQEHPIWNQFSPAERQRLIDEDLAAGRSVPALLTAVVTIGLLLGVITLAALLSL